MTTSEARALINTVKDRMEQPPTAVTKASKIDACCVAGAFCVYLHEQFMEIYPHQDTMSGFPAFEVVAWFILKLNPLLTLDQAEEYARLVISLNDTLRFEESWLALERALTWKPPPDIGILARLNPPMPTIPNVRSISEPRNEFEFCCVN